jgi:hypothetical protein
MVFGVLLVVCSLAKKVTKEGVYAMARLAIGLLAENGMLFVSRERVSSSYHPLNQAPCIYPNKLTFIHASTHTAGRNLAGGEIISHPFNRRQHRVSSIDVFLCSTSVRTSVRTVCQVFQHS